VRIAVLIDVARNKHGGENDDGDRHRKAAENPTGHALQLSAPVKPTCRQARLTVRGVAGQE
jgi:hypothetical protein